LCCPFYEAKNWEHPPCSRFSFPRNPPPFKDLDIPFPFFFLGRAGRSNPFSGFPLLILVLSLRPLIRTPFSRTSPLRRTIRTLIFFSSNVVVDPFGTPVGMLQVFFPRPFVAQFRPHPYEDGTVTTSSWHLRHSAGAFFPFSPPPMAATGTFSPQGRDRFGPGRSFTSSGPTLQQRPSFLPQVFNSSPPGNLFCSRMST